MSGRLFNLVLVVGAVALGLYLAENARGQEFDGWRGAVDSGQRAVGSELQSASQAKAANEYTREAMNRDVVLYRTSWERSAPMADNHPRWHTQPIVSVGHGWDGRLADALNSTIPERYPVRAYQGPFGGHYVFGQPVRNAARLWLRVKPVRSCLRAIGCFLFGCG